MEMTVNTDLVIASDRAVFALPEVKRGVFALAGALPRLIRTVGRQRAGEMAMTGRDVGAREAMEWGLVNRVVVDEVGDGRVVVEVALEMAAVIVGNSPDSVILTRAGLLMGWEGVGECSWSGPGLGGTLLIRE
jgi:enoyl-CoA hydratase/carnithine racemase